MILVTPSLDYNRGYCIIVATFETVFFMLTKIHFHLVKYSHQQPKILETTQDISIINDGMHEVHIKLILN